MKHKRFLRSVLATLLSSAMLLTPVLAQGIAETISQLSTPTLSEDEVPAVLDFEEMKAKGHVKRLYEEETEMNQAVFENEDGTRTAYLFTEAIKYVDEDGKTKDKSQKLKSKFTVFENEENDLKVVYNRNLENGIALEYGGLEIEMFPQGIDQNVKSKVVKESKKNLSDSVEYKKAFGNHTTLRYLQSLNGIKEEILLEKETELRRFTFRILTHGAALAEEKGKARIFKGEESFDLGEILMWDSAGKQAKGSYLIETVKEKEEYLLTMDTGDFLDREDLQYPVTVDPSINLSDEYPVEDVVVNENYYDYANGNSPVINLGNYNLLDEDEKDMSESGFLIEEKGNGAALFYFSDITTEHNQLYDLFMNGQVISAELRVKVLNSNVNSSTPIFMEAYAVTDHIDWNESEMMWDDCFDDGLKKLDRQHIQLSLTTDYYLDISNAVQMWFNGLDSCVILKNTNQSSHPLTIASSEYSTSSCRPYLYVTYNTESFDDQVFRLKHVQSGLYATVESWVDADTTDIDLWTRCLDLNVVDGPYSEMDRSQLFRLRSFNGNYTINPICSGNGYDRRISLETDNENVAVTSGFYVSLLKETRANHQTFNLVSNGEYGQFEIVTSANPSCGLGASQNAAGCQLMIRNRSGNNCLWQLEPAYDYHQIEDYYTEMGASYFFNLNDGLGSYETTITSGYGTLASEIHLGVDIGAGMYTNILAPFAARVTSVGTNASDSRGYHVYIEATDPRFTSFENGNPLRMVFMHMQSSPYVSYGSTIAAGMILGQVGSTGDSTEPHLRVSLIVTGDAWQTINNTVDPLMLYGSGNLVVDWP